MSTVERKWWHTTLRILDRQSQLKTFLTTASTADPATNASDFILAFSACDSVIIPPAAFNTLSSPGYFIYRPSLDDLGGESGGNYYVPRNYDQTVALNNRFIYEYKLGWAYDSTDIDCFTDGPPDTVSSTLYDIEEDVERGAVFLFPSLPYFDRIGCCEIDVESPGDPILPGDVNDCYRYWNISLTGGEYHLYSWDFSAGSGSELVDRGDIISSGIGTLLFHDIAWDSDNRLWGLEEEGLRQIIPGDADSSAIALNYATINDVFNGAAVAELFPIETSSDGMPGMSFNQHNDKLYISANDHFFELEKTSDAVWNIVRYQNLGEESELRDFAFDPYGQCFCIYNGNLCKINFEQAFGSLTAVTTDDSFLTMISLDFVLDFDRSQFVNLYALDVNGQIYEVNYNTGTYTAQPGESFGLNTVGGSSCQAGEDLRESFFPFDPGVSPWIFMLDHSGSMSSFNRWSTLTEGMIAFLENNVQLNEEMVIATYDDNYSASPRFIFRTQSDIDAAISYVQNLPVPSGAANFCSNGPFNTTFLQNYQNIKNIVVIGDGGFDNCPTGSLLSSHIQGVYDAAKTAGNPDLVMRGVGIFPDNLGREHLTMIGEIGGGGYTEWI